MGTLAGLGIQEHDELELVSEIVMEKEPLVKEVSKEVLENLNFSAPVRIPSREALAIPLVPSSTVYHLEEYRSDQMRWEAVMWAFIGAILGIIINWVTSESMIISRTSLIVLT